MAWANFRVADHPGVIDWGLESKCRVSPLPRIAFPTFHYVPQQQSIKICSWEKFLIDE